MTALEELLTLYEAGEEYRQVPIPIVPGLAARVRAEVEAGFIRELASDAREALAALAAHKETT